MKYPQAVKPPAVSGEQTCHADWKLSRGVVEGTSGTLICRIIGYCAAAISSCAFTQAATGHSILDCPEQSQTSPISTSLISRVFFPCTLIDVGVLLAIISGSFTSQRPFSEVFTVSLFDPMLTVTISPAAAQPQIRSGICCCSTM